MTQRQPRPQRKGRRKMTDDADTLITDILDAAGLDDDSARSVEKPIGVDSRAVTAAVQPSEPMKITSSSGAAEKQIGRMPDEGETIHMVVSAAYRTVDLVPAWLALEGPEPIERLYVATLSLSTGNVWT